MYCLACCARENAETYWPFSIRREISGIACSLAHRTLPLRRTSQAAPPASSSTSSITGTKIVGFRITFRHLRPGDLPRTDLLPQLFEIVREFTCRLKSLSTILFQRLTDDPRKPVR